MKRDEFSRYLDYLAEGLGHADRKAGLKTYCKGLMLPLSRKSVEPLAARMDPLRVSARHQSLLHFVGQSDWSDKAMLDRVLAWVQPALGAVDGKWYWIVDDTGYPKQGCHSVGVARQYCGQLGKAANCQVAVTLSLATSKASVPIAWQLYLPASWCEDVDRREAVGVPESIGFATKPEIALHQIWAAKTANVPGGIVVADAAYGNANAFREGLAALEVDYVVGIGPGTNVWAPGAAPLPPKVRHAGSGGQAKHLRRGPGHEPVSVKALALGLPASAFRTVKWREGTNGSLRSRFARLRIRPSHRDYYRTTQHDEVWLLIEWPKHEAEPARYWLSNLSVDISMEELVATAKMRWRIERDYEELKQEFGLGHYEGRGWRGFHHHATLCIAAYGFLLERRLRQKKALRRQTPALSDGHGSHLAHTRPAPCARFDPYAAADTRRRTCPSTWPLPNL